MSYDSTKDTKAHIARVGTLLHKFAQGLHYRAITHDASKLKEPEKSAFDAATPTLAGTTYGSDEYYTALAKLKPALEHHYANNSHHPEHYKDGVAGMDLYDLVEMFLDWKAASERHDDGDIWLSIEKNEERFDLSPQLKSILINTANEMFAKTE
jgi:hypothetical protein